MLLLIYRMNMGRLLDIAQLMIENGAPLNLHDEEGSTPFETALFCGEEDLVKYMIDVALLRNSLATTPFSQDSLKI